MRCFPVCTDIEHQTVMLTGAGRLVYQRLGKLRPFGCKIRLFATEGFDELSDDPQVELIRRQVLAEDFLLKPVFVLVAGASIEESRQISVLCREYGIPVNVADVPELCSFYVPAMIVNGSLTVSVSTDGKYPAAAALIRQRLEAQIPSGIDAILDWAQEIRQQLKTELPDPSKRSTVLRAIMEEAMNRNGPLSAAELDAFLK